jgi:signal peptidase I
MAEAMTAETAASTSRRPRRLHPALAFLAAWFGFGYLYVGRMGYAIVFLAAPWLFLFVAGLSRVLLHPVAWYSTLPLLVAILLVPAVHPVALAWSRPYVPPKRYNRWWWYVVWSLGTVVVALLVASYRGAMFGYDHYYIPASSMAPTLQAGDRIAVDTWRYRDSAPAFGDIVICDFGDGTLLTKRVVGLPGDIIELRGWRLVRNGAPVDEPYLSPEQGLRAPDIGPLTLGADEFFVVGDNRGNSNDSRYRGPLASEQVSGRVEFIYFSSSPGTVNWDRFPVMLAAD